MNTTLSKWIVTLGLAIAGGIIAYSGGHQGPPKTPDDVWNLLVVTLTTAGLGAGSRLINKSIDKQGN